MVGTSFAFGIDQLFFVSAFLSSLRVLECIDKRPGWIDFVQAALHRVIRIAPTFYAILFSAWFSIWYLGEGTIWLRFSNNF